MAIPQSGEGLIGYARNARFVFAQEKKWGQPCPIFSGHADLPARAAVPDRVGRGSARYIGEVSDLGSRNWAGRDPEKSAQHAISMLGANAPLEGSFPCVHLGCALEREIEERPWSMAWLDYC